MKAKTFPLALLATLAAMLPASPKGVHRWEGTAPGRLFPPAILLNVGESINGECNRRALWESDDLNRPVPRLKFKNDSKKEKVFHIKRVTKDLREKGKLTCYID